MKTLFVSLVVLFFAFFLGCQSSVTDPLAPDNTNNIVKDAARCVPGVIKLEATMLNEQPTDAGEFNVDGWIKYNLELTDADAGTPTLLVKVSMTMIADFTNEVDNQSPWKVKSSATEIVYVPSAGNAFTTFKKTFKVTNAKGKQIEIKPRFQVSSSALAVETIDVTSLSNEYPYTKVR